MPKALCAIVGDGGQALGMNYRQTMGSIVLPQAFRNMIPVLLTQTIVLFQDVSLVYVLSIPDFVGAASKIAQRDGEGGTLNTLFWVLEKEVCSGGNPPDADGVILPLECADAESEENSTGTGRNMGSVYATWIWLA